MSACQPQFSCPPGTYVMITGCTPCPAGQYSSSINALQCTPCPLGTYRPTAGANGSGACFQCTPGTYGDQEGTSAAACTSCPPATFNPLSGATSSAACRQCPAGTFGTEIGATQASQCVSCSAGYYAASAASTSCEPCDAGRYSTSVGAKSSSSCLACLPGTWSNVTGANTSSACLPCEAGSYNPSFGSTACFFCLPGSYSNSLAATGCISCPPGSYNPTPGANSPLACIPCDPGSYGLSSAATSNASCIPCSPGEYRDTFGSIIPCTLCPAGYYANTSRSSLCVLCPAGSYSFFTGSSTCSLCQLGYYSSTEGATGCLQCGAATYSNSTGSLSCTECSPGTASRVVGSTSDADCVACDPGSYADAFGLISCLPCPPGLFQNESGMSHCEVCPPGSSSSMSRSTSCTPCQPGFYSPVPGLAQCLSCPSGTLQLQPGGTSCALCPRDFDELPVPLLAHLAIDVCGSLLRAVMLNWGPVENPELLATVAAVADPSDVPTWLTVRVAAAKIITFTSDLIPSSASLNRTLNITLSVNHSCRSTLWLGTVSLELLRADPVLIPDSRIAAAGVEACPDFALQYSVLLGTCSAQTTVTALLANGSALPPFVSYAYGNGVLAIVGTIPPGTSAFEVVGVAQLGDETFLSKSTLVSLVPSVELKVTTQQTDIRACPYVSTTFTVSRKSSCGQLHLWASLANGSALPYFLSGGSSTSSGVVGGDGSITSLTVFGTVPAHFPEFSIVASASTGSAVFNSIPVKITRPQLTSSANVSLLAGNASMVTASTQWVPLELSARYGIPLYIEAWIDAGSEPMCSSISIVVSSSAGDGSSRLPFWISATPASPTSMLIAANPSSGVFPGTTVSLYVWVNDGLRNPGFNLSIVVESSLHMATSTDNSTLPTVVTPASLLQMQLDVIAGGGATVKPVLICPTTTAAAFCSVGSAPGSNVLSVGSFGTPSGVNAVLHGLSAAISHDSSTNASNVMLQLTFKESVNPNALVLQVPLSALRVYSGVKQIKPLSLAATVGKAFNEPISSYFHSLDGGTLTYELLESNATSWLALQGDKIGGVPPSLPALQRFAVGVSDKYTHLTAECTVNVSWPMTPTVNLPDLSHWFVPSTMQVDILLSPDVIVDPENGTILFDLRMYTDRGADSQPLPMFLVFDANNLRITGTPHAEDVGFYPLVLTGTSRWGSWTGNATVLLTITVEQSWGDFFAWVYSIVGYTASAIGTLTWCLVYRKLLTNIVMFRRRMRAAPPTELLKTGCYVLRYVAAADLPIPIRYVKAVRVTLVEKPCPPPKAYHFSYFTMMSRLSNTKVKTDLITGVLWMHIMPTRDKTLELIVDTPMLQHFVATGKVFEEDEYFVEVTSRGWWSSGTIVEAFTFIVADIVGDRSTCEAVEDHEVETMLQLSADIKNLSHGLTVTEKFASLADGNAAQARKISELVQEDCRYLRLKLDKRRQAFGERIDPYTGQALHEPMSDCSTNDENDEEMTCVEPPVPLIEL